MLKPTMSSVLVKPKAARRIGMSSAPREMAASTSAKNTPNTRATTSRWTVRCRAVIASTSTTMVPAPRTTSMANAIGAEWTMASSAVGNANTIIPATMMVPSRRMPAMRFMNGATMRPPTPSAASRYPYPSLPVPSCCLLNTTNSTVSVPYRKLATMLNPASTTTVDELKNALIPTRICCSGPSVPPRSRPRAGCAHGCG